MYTVPNKTFLESGITAQNFCTCILRILGITFSLSNSANLCEITTLVVCIPFNFVPCYSSIIIQQQFLIPCICICILEYM